MFWPFGRGCQKPLGQRGEDIARKCCRRAGMKVLARNYRCPAGEADLIVLDPSTGNAAGGETIAFVEVKTRTSDRYTSPASAVDDRKRQQLRGVARYYLQHHDAEGYQVRFDVVAVVLREGQEPQVTYIRDAFRRGP